MKVFLIGFSGLGKSPLAQKLMETLPTAHHIRAGEWVRRSVPPGSSVEEMAQFSRDKLRENPDKCLNFIYGNYDLEHCYRNGNEWPEIFILDGIRNPRDFAHLFDPRYDLVVFLGRAGVEAQSSFEANGIAAIWQYVKWLQTENLLRKSESVLNLWFASLNRYSTGRMDNQTLNPGGGQALSLPDLEEAIEPIVRNLSSLKEF
jgi:adenylate kinase family enzyme